jgi:ParB family chromosome partitioning protein
MGEVLQIVAGERRWRAAEEAGLERVPVLVREADDRQMLEMALIENVQRADLNAMDRARGYERLCDEFGLSAEQVGRLVGEDRTTVTNYIRLLELPREVKELVSAGGISMGHARCLLGVEHPERQMQLAKATVENELSVRALEETVRRERSERSKAVAPVEEKAAKSAHVADLESRFQRALGTKVAIRQSRRKGRGRIVIEYQSLDDFDRIATALGVELE